MSKWKRGVKINCKTSKYHGKEGYVDGYTIDVEGDTSETWSPHLMVVIIGSEVTDWNPDCLIFLDDK